MIVFGFIALFVLAYIVGNCLYKRTNDYKNRLVTIRDYENGVPMNIKVAAFGSTYGKYAFNSLADMGVNGFNFCLEAEPLQCDLKLIKKYASHLSPDCIVFINLAACVACCKEEDVVVLNADNYYKLFNSSDLPNSIKYSIKHRLKYYLPVGIKSVKKFGRIILDTPLINNVADRHPVSVSDDEARKNMQIMANGWINMFHLRDLKDKDIPADIQHRITDNEKTLNKIIYYCQSKGWRPVIVVPPASSELNGYFSDAFINKVLTNIINNSIKGKSVPVFNFLKAEEFQHNWTLFCDGGFRLNKYGSKKFIRQLCGQMNKKDIEINNSKLVYGDNKQDKIKTDI